MTTSPVVTTGEQVAETLHRLGYLIGQHDLPAPKVTEIRTYAGVKVDLMFHSLGKFQRWVDVIDTVIDTAVTTSSHPDGYQHVACTVLGDVPLRMTAWGKALTP
jgi:hypothetical protein